MLPNVPKLPVTDPAVSSDGKTLRAAVRDFSAYGSGLTDASPDFENCYQPSTPEGRIVDVQLGSDQKPVYDPVSGADGPICSPANNQMQRLALYSVIITQTCHACS